MQFCILIIPSGFARQQYLQYRTYSRKANTVSKQSHSLSSVILLLKAPGEPKAQNPFCTPSHYTHTLQTLKQVWTSQVAVISWAFHILLRNKASRSAVLNLFLSRITSILVLHCKSNVDWVMKRVMKLCHSSIFMFSQCLAADSVLFSAEYSPLSMEMKPRFF